MGHSMKKLFAQLKKGVTFLWRTFRNALFVKDIKCIVCNAELKETNKYCMCEECLKKLPYTSGQTCYKCGDKIVGSGSYCLNCKDSEKEYEQARAPFLYEGAIQILIYKLKYSGAKYLAPYMSLFLVDEFVKQDWKVDLVIPVPLHKAREKKRGFNQAELLSCAFKTKLNMQVLTNNLVRVKNTPTQTKLTRVERNNNLKKAFEVLNKAEIKNKNVLIIDDVFTTGATIEECSNVLKAAGAKNIYILTLAHVNHSIPMY